MPRLKKKWRTPPAESATKIEQFTGGSLNVRHAAQYLDVPVWTVRCLIKSGDLPFIKAGKRFIVSKVTLDEWLRRTSVGQAA